MVDRLEAILTKLGIVTDANPVTYQATWGKQVLAKGEFAGRSIAELVQQYCTETGKKAQSI